MTERRQIYRCVSCGNIIEVLNAADGTLSCCNQPMKLLRENTSDGAKEKHVPIVERIEDGYKVSVGSVEHPMTDAHYIQWIEIASGRETHRKYLTPEDKPEATFKTDAKDVEAREYCNLHGLWKA